MVSHKIASVLTPLFCFFSVDAFGLTAEHTSRVDFQEKTAYGTLAFNLDAINSSQNRSFKRYYIIKNNGEVSLPAQWGYCFLFNHYGSESDAEQHYEVEIKKSFEDGTAILDPNPPLKKLYFAASWLGSRSMPDFCITSSVGLTRVDIKTRSTDGISFSHEFFFSIDLKDIKN